MIRRYVNNQLFYFMIEKRKMKPFSFLNNALKFPIQLVKFLYYTYDHHSMSKFKILFGFIFSLIHSLDWKIIFQLKGQKKKNFFFLKWTIYILT